MTADIVHRVDGIHGGGPRIFQNLINRLDVGGKFLQVAAAKGERALRQAVGCGGTDGAGTAHDHVGDGGGGGAEIWGGDDFEFVREQPLLDEEDGVLRAVKGDGAEMPGAALDGDVHKNLLIYDLVQHGSLEPSGYLASLQLQHLAFGYFGEPGVTWILRIRGVVKNISAMAMADGVHQ